MYNFPGVKGEYCAINESLCNKGDYWDKGILQCSTHRVKLHISCNGRGRWKKVVDNLPEMGNLGKGE